MKTVKTQIRLFLREQPDQGLHCLSFRLCLLDALLSGLPHCSNFSTITAFASLSDFFSDLTLLHDCQRVDDCRTDI